MPSYIVLGHGAEKLKEARPIVPPGCMLVLTEECGMSGVLPHSLYPVLADPANTPLFDDPVRHKAAVEALLKRPIRIYTSGESYPAISYTLLSHEDDSVGPSGLFALPTPSFVFNAKRGEGRYLVPMREASRAFAGAAVPARPPAQPLRPLRKTQAELFAAKPGVHYSLLCRIIAEEDRIKELIEEHFPEVPLDDIFTIHDYDTFQTAAAWIKTLRPGDRQHAVAQIQAIIDAVMERRRASGSPLGSSTNVMTLLAMRGQTQAQALAQAIEGLRDTEQRDHRTGYTPLMLAARMGHEAAVHALLLKGADPNSRDLEGTTPLIFACSAGALEICKELLAAGADPRIVTEDGTTALLVACGNKALMEFIPALLAAGADPTVADDDGDTPLHVAASNGLHAILADLVSAGADPNSQNEEGKTPLMLAAEDGEMAAAAALIPITDINIRSKGRSALALAVLNGKEDIAIALVHAGVTVMSWKRLHEMAVAKGLTRLALIKRDTGPLTERRTLTSERRTLTAERRTLTAERRTRRKSTNKVRFSHRNATTNH